MLVDPVRLIVRTVQVEVNREETEHTCVHMQM